MNGAFQVDKALVELLRNRPYELQTSGPTENLVSANVDLIPKQLKAADRLVWPDFPPKHTVHVFCSVIHVQSVIVFLLAQNSLRNTGVELQVEFDPTSSAAIQKFRKATREGLPALVTVTKGTAKVLSESQQGFGPFMEVPHSYLRWGSTEKIEQAELSELEYAYVGHPTDRIVFEEFTQNVIGRDKQLHSTVLEHPPECIDILSTATRNKVFLVDPFMGSWGGRVLQKPLIFLDDWKDVERRFIFGNPRFWNLADGKGTSVAHWLQIYLQSKFEDPGESIAQFVTTPRIGKEDYTKLVRTDYFKL